MLSLNIDFVDGGVGAKSELAGVFVELNGAFIGDNGWLLAGVW